MAKIDDPSGQIALGEKPTDSSLPISSWVREETDDRHQHTAKPKSNVLMIDGHARSGNYFQYVDFANTPHF